MTMTTLNTPLARLRQFVHRPAEAAGEACELCAAPLAAVHDHLLELEHRRIACACRGCAILFDNNARQRYQRIPPDVFRLRGFRMDDLEWQSLMVPIDLAFFPYSSRAGAVVAMYPSPAGIVESALEPDCWNPLAARNPVLTRMSADVEALLVNRLNADDRNAGARYYRAPMDWCFRLAGIVRRNWRGLWGGSEVWREVDLYFAELDRIALEDRHA